MQDVADHRPGRRGDDADDVGQERQVAFAVFVEEAFLGQFAATILEEFEERPFPRQLQGFDDDLVLGASGIGGQPPGGHHLHAVFRVEAQTGGGTAPADPVQHGFLVLQGKIEVPGSGPLETGDFPLHANPGKSVLHRPLENQRYLADAQDRQVIPEIV